MTGRSTELKTVEEAINLIFSELSEAEKKHLASKRKDELIGLHLGWGMAIRNWLGLWSPYSEIIRDFGTRTTNNHPDDVSMYIIEKIWEKLQDNSDA